MEPALQHVMYSTTLSSIPIQEIKDCADSHAKAMKHSTSMELVKTIAHFLRN